MNCTLSELDIAIRSLMSCRRISVARRFFSYSCAAICGSNVPFFRASYSIYVASRSLSILSSAKASSLNDLTSARICSIVLFSFASIYYSQPSITAVKPFVQVVLLSIPHTLFCKAYNNLKPFFAVLLSDGRD